MQVACVWAKGGHIFVERFGLEAVVEPEARDVSALKSSHVFGTVKYIRLTGIESSPPNKKCEWLRGWLVCSLSSPYLAWSFLCHTSEGRGRVNLCLRRSQLAPFRSQELGKTRNEQSL